MAKEAKRENKNKNTVSDVKVVNGADSKKSDSAMTQDAKNKSKNVKSCK